MDHSWNLEIVDDIVRETGWSKVLYKGKAMFMCHTCENEWHCDSSGVIFYYHLSGSGNGQYGEVKLFLGGQKCIRCNNAFEAANWDDKAMEYAITKLLNEVKDNIYGLSPGIEICETPAFILEIHQRQYSQFCQLCSLEICLDGEIGKNSV